MCFLCESSSSSSLGSPGVEDETTGWLSKGEEDEGDAGGALNHHARIKKRKETQNNTGEE